MAHAHAHDHAHQQDGVSRKLAAATIVTAVFVVVEVGVGLAANSLALLGDALHNFTDALALALAFAAVRLARRPATTAKTYGYHRAGVLAAFINAATLVAFTFFLFWEAWQRFRQPQPVRSGWMLSTAIAALILNSGITWLLQRESAGDLNVRAAVIHMIGDAIASAGIIVAALLIRSTGSAIFDPLVSVLIGALILGSSWGILREAVNLLLEGTPTGIDIDAVARSLAAEDGVYGVHHLHIWAIGPSRPALSCHVMLGDVALRSTGDILRRIGAMLEHDYGIVHTTVQFEFATCSADDPYCIPFTATADVRSIGAASDRR
jgi:cobalt-zinc-cadmium efflux system protein